LESFDSVLSGEFVYMDLREANCPELVEALSKLKSPQWDSSKTRILSALLSDAPGIELIQLLSDKSILDKNIVLYELARISDPTVVKQIARSIIDSGFAILTDGHKLDRMMVEHALNAIARTGTHEAIGALINLLEVDLPTFADQSDKDYWRNQVAMVLIDLTGESYGVEARQWQEWYQRSDDFAVPREYSYPESVYRESGSGSIDIGNP
jgi:HEAT repeat protein